MRVFELFEDQAAGLLIQWKPPKACRAALEEGTETIVWVDVAKLDASFKFDRGFYVGPQGSENGIAGRFDTWVKGGEPVEMSEVGFGARGNVTFTNGRHRYAWMRDHGAEAIPVVTETSRAKEFVEQFGTSLRQTVVR
jgi:hypothetical protein